MKKNRVTELIAKKILQDVPVCEPLLHGAMFTKNGNDWVMGTLTIFGGDGYYFYTPTGQKSKLKNMQQVSDLVYGNTPFLDMSNA